MKEKCRDCSCAAASSVAGVCDLGPDAAYFHADHGGSELARSLGTNQVLRLRGHRPISSNIRFKTPNLERFSLPLPPTLPPFSALIEQRKSRRKRKTKAFLIWGRRLMLAPMGHRPRLQWRLHRRWFRQKRRSGSRRNAEFRTPN